MAAVPAPSQPLVSVIIACYNHGRYIEQCIASVLGQTYPAIELLVVDDGSSDDSVARISRLQQVHGFDFQAQANQGLSATLNAAIGRSRGSLIVPFGSDDVMCRARIERQVACLQGKPEVGICAGNVEEIDSAGKPVRPVRTRPARRLDFAALFHGRVVPAATMMIRRDAFMQVGGFDPDICLEDLLIQLKITHAGYVIEVLDEVLALYRIHPGNTHKNHRFMVDNVLRTYAQFSDHPDYAQVRERYCTSMFLKTARNDKALARTLLAQLPLNTWTSKTWRGVWRLLLPAQVKPGAKTPRQSP